MAEGFDWLPSFLRPQAPAQPQPAAPAQVVRPRRAPPPVRLSRPKPRPVEPAAPVQPAVQPTFFVDVYGDNLGLMMAQGLQEAFADKPEIGIVRKVKESSGLVREDYYDWVKAAHDLLGGKDRIDYAVMLVGSNDSQSIHDATGTYEIRSDKWKELYAKRVDEIMKQFQERKVPLVWVGLPIVRSEKLASDMAYINDILRDEAAKTGATFVDTWEAFVDDQGQYSDYGPDLSGERVRLRTSDGIHFTKAGTRKLAMFVESDINKAFDDAQKPVDLASIVSGQDSAGPAMPSGVPTDVDILLQRSLAHRHAEGPSLTSFPQPGLSYSALGLRAAQWASAFPQPGLSYGGKLAGTAVANAALGPSFRPGLIDVAVPDVPLPAIPVKPLAGRIFPLTTPPLAAGGELASGASKAATADSDAVALVEHALIEGKPVDARPGRADDFSWPKH